MTIAFISTGNAKKAARTLEKALAAAGLALPHGLALDVVSKITGLANWPSMTEASLRERVDQLLLPQDLSYARNSEDCEYRNTECVIPLASGFQLRSDTEATLEYVRVADPCGRDIAYYTGDEFVQDPLGVVGALLGAMARYSGGTQRVASPEPAPALPSVGKLPFEWLTAVIVDGEAYEVVSHTAEVCHWAAQNLGMSDPSGSEGQGEREAFCLLAHDESGDREGPAITGDMLRRLEWSPTFKCFRDPVDFTSYEFRYEQIFGA